MSRKAGDGEPPPIAGAEPVKKPKATWVEPVMEAEVAYSTVTENALLREAVFQGTARGFRFAAGAPACPHAPADGGQPASEWRTAREHPAAASGRRSAFKRGTRRLLGEGLEAGPRASRAQTAQARPSRQRHDVLSQGQAAPCPGGGSQAHDRKREGGEGTRLWVDDLADLLGLVEIGVVELHAWNASLDDIEHPDMLVFDLDPGEGVAWDLVIETALRLRRC